MYKIDFSKPIHIHFIGIGGISMSGLAEILHEEGFTISGSDSKESDLTKTLAAKGIKVIYGQSADNITSGIDLVVYTAAIHESNPEFAAAKAAGIPMLTRAELLGQIMDNYDYSIAVAGTHGKTTTTSMISEILLAAQTDPTISVGGILSSIHGNLRVGDSEYFISEACEYTNSFLNFRPRYSIILNIEAEHLDFFKDINDIRHSFREYASNTLAGGATIINGEIDRYEEIVAGLPQKIITYGFDSKYDFYPENITYDDKACASFTAMRQGSPLFDVKLSVPGAHNVSNAPDQTAKGIVCASAGNHAQGVALSCNKLGIAGKIFMPVTTPKQKINQVRMFGGNAIEVVLAGDTFDESNRAAMQACENEGKTFIPPFNHPKIIEGQGTVGLEILQQSRAAVDYIFVPIGGGGLASGIGSVYKQMSPQTKIIGVEPAGAAGMKLSIERGEVTEIGRAHV